MRTHCGHGCAPFSCRSFTAAVRSTNSRLSAFTSAVHSVPIATGRLKMVDSKKKLKTYSNGTRCDECCTKLFPCDDRDHHDRLGNPGCPHCRNTGWALWTEVGQKSYAKHLGWDAYREDLVAN